jgi:hypothetical protein
MRGAIPPLPQYAFMAWCSVKKHRDNFLPLPFTIVKIQLTPLTRVLLEKLVVTQLVNKFSTFYGTRRFIIVFTRARHWSLSSARCIQSTPSHLTSPRSILLKIWNYFKCNAVVWSADTRILSINKKFRNEQRFTFYSCFWRPSITNFTKKGYLLPFLLTSDTWRPGFQLSDSQKTDLGTMSSFSLCIVMWITELGDFWLS